MSDRATLKSFYETNDVPTEGQYADLIDSMVNIDDDLNNKPAFVQFVKLSLTSAQVLALNSTPRVVVPAPGAAFAVVCVAASFHVIFNTTPYASFTQLRIIADTANASQVELSGALNKTVDAFGILPNSFVLGPTLTQMVPDKSLNVTVASGNPTAGDSPVDIFMVYKLLPV